MSFDDIVQSIEDRIRHYRDGMITGLELASGISDDLGKVDRDELHLDHDAALAEI